MTAGTHHAVMRVLGNRHAGGCANMADSRVGRGEWLRTGTLPAFGQPPTTEECDMAFAGLDAETLLCRRAAPDGTTEAVNILHVSPDVGRVGAEIARVVDFMESRGFTVERKGQPHKWANTDVLILGMDGGRLSHMDRTLDTLVRGAGLVLGWDVLLYGLDGMPTFEPDLDGSPLLAGQNFGPDAVCMLHAHVRLRGSMQFWAGHLAHMADRIEYGITLLIGNSPHGKPSGDGSNLFHKINTLADEFGKAGLRESDIELFRHAAHLIRAVRNAHVHFLADPKWPEQRVRGLINHMKGFYNVAKLHARDDLLLGARRPDAGDAGTFGALTPLFVRLALLVDRWLIDCLRRCTSLPPELRGDAGQPHIE